MKAPRLVVDTFQILDDGTRVPAGKADLTSACAEYMAPHRTLQRPMERPPKVMQIASGLSREQSRLAWDSKLGIPDILEAIDAFTAEVGLENMWALREHLNEASHIARRIEQAENVLNCVETAAVGDPATMGYFVEVLFGDTFVDSLEEAYSGMIFGRFADEHPIPRFDTPEHEAWMKAAERWKAESVPNFVFGTRPVEWEGLSATDLRQAMEDEGETDPDGMISSDLEEHFEDAYEHVVGVAAAIEYISAWEKHAGSGSPEDLALEGWLEQWNARQNIVSHYMDTKVVVPLRPSVTRQDMQDWCRRHIEAEKARLENFLDTWRPDAPVPSAA